MPSKKRKSEPSEIIYSSRPLLKQRHFLAPRRRIKRLADSTVPSSLEKKKQQTLTQIEWPLDLSDDDEELRRNAAGDGVDEQMEVQNSESDADWVQSRRIKRRRRNQKNYGPTSIKSQKTKRKIS